MNSVMQIADKIKSRRQAKGLKPKEVAARAGLSLTYYYDIEKGRRKPNVERLDSIARALDISLGELVYDVPGAFPLPKPPKGIPARIPVVGMVKAGKRGFFDDQGYPVGEGFDTISRPYDVRDANAYGVKVEGDSMRPKFDPGDIVVASPMRVIRNGDYVVARLTNGEVMVKRYRESNQTVILESINTAFAPVLVTREELRFLHRVVWVKAKG